MKTSIIRAHCFKSGSTNCFKLYSSITSADKEEFNTLISEIPSGLCAVYKPKNWTSSDVVSKIRLMLEADMRKSLGRKVKIKVGHGGTLDPLAEGVLVLGIGSGTKSLTDYLSGSKGYLAKAVLGKEMDTLDITGTVVEAVDSSHITTELLQQLIPEFTGNITQVPPMYSALKKDGKKLYELARQGIEVEREARNLTVYRLSLIEDIKIPEFGLIIECSGGFYVRSLISDIGRKAKSAAYMTELLRTKQGPFTLDDCLLQKDWNTNNICNHIIKCSSIVGLETKNK
eukprot:gene8926-12037_t